MGWVEWDEAWAGIDDAWRRGLTLAWEAFAGGSIAVGAVVLGPDGRVVAEGRNRSADDVPPPGQLGGSFIAHAEVNALGQLPRSATEPITLLSTLEPCALCRAASRHAHAAEVHYAAADPVWDGMERMGELNAFFGRRWPRFVHTDLGPFSTWCGAVALVSVAHGVSRRESVAWKVVLADDPVIARNQKDQPAYVGLAEILLNDGLAPGTDLDVEAALANWWPAIVSADGRTRGRT